MRSDTVFLRVVGKTNGECQILSFLDQEDRELWVRDCI